jgi:hypothetical protein
MKNRDIDMKRQELPQKKIAELFCRTPLNSEVELPEFCKNSVENGVNIYKKMFSPSISPLFFTANASYVISHRPKAPPQRYKTIIL